MLIALGALDAAPSRAQTTTSSAPDPSTRSPAPATESTPRGPAITQDSMAAHLAASDKGRQQILTAIARWEKAPRLIKDFRRVDIGDDMRRHTLPETTRADLVAWRAEAQRQLEAGDLPGVLIEVNRINREMNAAAERYRNVVEYWIARSNYDRRVKGWEKARRVNGLPDLNSQALRELDSRLNENVLANRFDVAARTDLPAVLALLNRTLDEARASAPGGVLKFDPVRRTRERACDNDAEFGGAASASAPIEVPTYMPDGTEIVDPPFTAPRFDTRRSKSTDGYYPSEARYASVQGVVSVRALVTQSGCVQWAEVVKSSGQTILDDAALDWVVEGAEFSPGTDQGRPREMATRLNVRFKLTP